MSTGRKVVFNLIEGQGYFPSDAKNTANRIHGYVEMLMQTGSLETVALWGEGLPEVSYQAPAHTSQPTPTNSSPAAQPEPQPDEQ